LPRLQRQRQPNEWPGRRRGADAVLKYRMAYELAHTWDIHKNNDLSNGLAARRRQTRQPRSASDYGDTSAEEDWAEMVAANVYGDISALSPTRPGHPEIPENVGRLYFEEHVPGRKVLPVRIPEFCQQREVP
jgi:hypothetical protein